MKKWILIGLSLIAIFIVASFLVPVREVVIPPFQRIPSRWIPPRIQMVLDPINPYGDHFYFQTGPNWVQISWHDVDVKKAYFGCNLAPCSGFLPLEGFNFPTTIDADGTVYIRMPLVWQTLP